MACQSLPRTEQQGGSRIYILGPPDPSSFGDTEPRALTTGQLSLACYLVTAHSMQAIPIPNFPALPNPLLSAAEGELNQNGAGDTASAP